jgi:hypothetical protein
MNEQPTCGKCGGIMTPENARKRPELFLHDCCLPVELRPPKERHDGVCKIETGLTRAEAFIHDRLHNGGPEWAEFGAWGKLNTLPFILFPIVGRLMEAYHQERLREEANKP